MGDRLRLVSTLAAAIGAAGSAMFLLRAAHRNPSVLLLVLMTIWVVAPFLALLAALRRSRGWPELSRKSLDIVAIFIAGGALAVYTIDAISPPKAQAARVFVVVPAVSWIPIGVVLSRRRGH